MTDSGICTFTGHTILCGWNEHAQQVLTELEAAGRQVAVITGRRPAELDNSRAFFVAGDPSSDEALKRAGVMSAASAIILAENALTLAPDLVDSHSILTALAVESLNRGAYTILEVLNPDNALHARHAHVDDIIFCNKVLAEIAASCSGQKGLAAVWNDILCHSDSGSALRTEEVGASWQGRSIGELFSAKEAEGKLPLGYIRIEDSAVSHSVNPPRSETIRLPMAVVLISRNQEPEQLDRAFQGPDA